MPKKNPSVSIEKQAVRVVRKIAMKYLTLWLALSAISIINCANILYLSNVPSPSHFIWCKSILNALHDRGHNVTALSGDVEESRGNMTYLHLDQMYSTIYNDTDEVDFFEYGKLSPAGLFKLYAEISEKACIGSVNSKGYKRLLAYPDNFKFDLIIVDFTMGPCVMAFADKFKNPPIVGVSPFFELARLARTSGALVYPSFVPGHDLLYTQRMDFLQRLNSAVTHALGIMAYKYVIVPRSDKVIREFHPNAPYLEDIERKIGIYLINNNPLIDYKEPVYSNVRLVGGVQVKKPKPLPAELKVIADNAKNGLVLFSLGTNVRSDQLGPERISKFVKVFGRLPKYTFLWKFETKEMVPNLPANVKIQSWMPQNDILAHHNTKLFMSHCGLLGIQEAMWFGVPILGFPVFGDQAQNSYRLVNELGVGEQLSILNFTETELYNGIKNMLENQKYQKKIKSIASAMRDRLQTPLEEAVHWIEWYSRHPEVDLQGPAAELNIFIRHSFDIFAVLFIILIAFLYLEFKLISFLIRKCCTSSKKKIIDDKKKKRN